MKHRPIAIYYEHPDWFRPLFAALDKRGLPYEKLNAATHFYDPGENLAQKYPLFFNRMSASAYLRGHGSQIFYTRGLLASLEQQNARVINGYEAFQIEISKALQAALFQKLGIKSPKTRIVNSAAQIVAAANGFEFPIIVKPNIGGRGAGIVKFNDLKELKDALAAGQIDLGIDSTALVQEFAPKKGDFITRVETLDGKFLYAIKIYPNDESFNLCPAEVCLIEDQRSAPTAGEMCIVEAAKSGLKIERTDVSKETIEIVERIVEAAKIAVGGVEFLIDDRTGDKLFYDINALSNFVADAEKLIGFDPHENLVDFLEKEQQSAESSAGIPPALRAEA